MSRVYEPKDNEVLSHYCSASTFQAIFTYGTLRFTDINMLNDTEEFRWAYSIFEEAATRLVKRIGVKAEAPIIEVEFIDSIDDIVCSIQLIAHPFVACFSLESDLLGQWRAYADDGRGFAVGFNAVALRRQLPVTFLKVLYDKEQQVKEMMAAILAIYYSLESVEQAGHDSKFVEDCALLGTYMTALKHPTFAEEKEVRAVHAVSLQRDGNSVRFVDNGGLVNENVRTNGNPVSFQVRDNHLVAYTDVALAPFDVTSPISEVVLGPKNHSAPGNLQLFLGGLSYTNLALRRSIVPYR